MLTVDIFVPVIEKDYDFSVDENIKIETVKEDIIDLIFQKEGYSSPEVFDMSLFSREREQILSPDLTLWECGIDNGDRLLLV